ncbi:uncharacterized protein [Haliotis cracherodii]|uniref:uncharacterized protein n=1 Tax=Haliotis cracherodii TaxID=6455 RepID=UPI0039EABBE8
MASQTHDISESHCVRATDPNGDGVLSQSDDADCTLYYECYETYHEVKRCPCPKVWQQSTESCIDYTCMPDSSDITCTIAVTGFDLALYDTSGKHLLNVEPQVSATVFDPFMDRLVFAGESTVKDSNSNGTEVDLIANLGIDVDYMAMGEDLFLVSGNKVYQLDGVNATTKLKVTAPAPIRDIRYNPNDKHLYYLVSNGEDAVYSFNPSDDPITVSSIEVNGSPDHLALNVNENELIYNTISGLYRHEIGHEEGHDEEEGLIMAGFPYVTALCVYNNKIYDIRAGMVEIRQLDGSLEKSFGVRSAFSIELYGKC